MRSLNLEGVRLPSETEKEKADTKLQGLKWQCFKVTERLKKYFIFVYSYSSGTGSSHHLSLIFL